jgi:trigger factor
MNSYVERLPNSRVRLTVEIDSPSIEEASKSALERLRRVVAVPGFRKGKAPVALVRQRLGDKVLREEAVGEVLEQVASEALSREGIRPLSRPSFELNEEPDGSVKAVAEFDVWPQIELDDRYKKLELKVPRVEPAPEEVEMLLSLVKRANSALGPASHTQAREGDFALVNLDLSGAVEEKVSVRDLVVPVGEANDLTKVLVGHGVGEVLEHEVDDAKRDRKVAARLLVKELLEPTEPAAGWPLSRTGFADEQSLRARIEQYIKDQRRLEARQVLSRELEERLIELYPVDVPRSLVSSVVSLELAEMQSAAQRSGFQLQEVVRRDPDRFKEAVENRMESAEREVRLELVLGAIAKKEGLVGGEEGQAGQGRHDWHRKVVRFLLEHAEIRDLEGNLVAKEELLEEEDASSPAGERNTGQGEEEG